LRGTDSRGEPCHGDDPQSTGTESARLAVSPSRSRVQDGARVPPVVAGGVEGSVHHSSSHQRRSSSVSCSSPSGPRTSPRSEAPREFPPEAPPPRVRNRIDTRSCPGPRPRPWPPGSSQATSWPVSSPEDTSIPRNRVRASSRGPRFLVLPVVTRAAGGPSLCGPQRSDGHDPHPCTDFGIPARPRTGL